MSDIVGSSTQMQDIPLPIEDEEGAIGEEPPKGISKTASLRRFLKLPSKKTAEQVAAAMSEADMNKPNEEQPQEQEEEAAGAKKKSTLGRFHLRMGGLEKYTSQKIKKPAELEESDEKTTPTKTNKSLKGSLSNYWNMVFKRNPSHSTRFNAGKSTAPEPEAAEKLENSDIAELAEGGEDDRETETEIGTTLLSEGEGDNEQTINEIVEDMQTLALSEEAKDEAAESQG